jgi:hypothetical protein
MLRAVRTPAPDAASRRAAAGARRAALDHAMHTLTAPAVLMDAAPPETAAPQHAIGDIAIGNPADGERKISASGAGTVSYTYTPEPSDRSTKIVFIQVMRELLDGKPVKPSEADGVSTHLDKDTTSDFMHVDYHPGEKDPYYNGDDARDHGAQGNAATGTAATSTDTPSYTDAFFPAGKSTLLWEFRTAAFSADGPDKGAFYEYVDWKYEKPKGAAATTSVGSTGKHPGSKFIKALDLWCSNHGFTLPGKSSLGATIGGILGAIIGGVAGALLGFIHPGLGVVGGIVGAGLGAAGGSAIGGLFD